MGSSQLPKSIEWVGDVDGFVRIIDQTRLPAELAFIECRDVQGVYDAIQRLCVRGAPVIGVTAAMGVVLGLRDAAADPGALHGRVDQVCGFLATARPTAVNLAWALDRMRRAAASLTTIDPHAFRVALLQEARHIRDEDAAMCRAIGQAGQALIRPGSGVLTHCNAGALATAEYGTALGVLYAAHERGRSFRVYVDETRPLLQGSRLTAWELMQAGIDVTVVCDNMAAVLMRDRKVDLVITGADRIAANGDTANKIGTYGLAVLAKAHDLPFYVAAPSSTFDLSMPDGSGIPIERRDPDEIRRGFGVWTAPPDAKCYSPAFDVTPAHLVHGIITEAGIIDPVTPARIFEVIRKENACRDRSVGRNC